MSHEKIFLWTIDHFSVYRGTDGQVEAHFYAIAGFGHEWQVGAFLQAVH